MKLSYKTAVVGLSALSLAIASPVALFATDTPATTNTAVTGSSTTPTTNTATVEQKDNPKGEQQQALVREKLAAVKQKVCETHQTAINNAMNDIRKASQNQFDRITKAYTTAKTYYGQHTVTVSNYDTLNAQVTSTQAAAQAALDALATSVPLSCTSDGPKAQIQDFRNKRLDKVSAFEAYRTAVKNYISAIRTAAHSSAATSTQTTGGQQ